MATKLAFDNGTTRTIQGKTYTFTLRNRGVFECERHLQSKNLLSVASGQVLCTEDLFTLFKYSALGGGTVLDDDAMFELFLATIAELGYDGMTALIIDVFVASGILGNVKKPKAAKA